MRSLPTGWVWSSVAEVGKVELGRQRHPHWHTGPNMRPYLRVANVFEDRIDVSDLKEMDFTGVFERFKLHPGDVLLNEGQTPELLGRPAIYRGYPESVAFTNSLIRFQAGPDVTPEWALLVFRHHMHSGRFKRESRITTNIAHLSATRLKAVEFPVPPLDEQRRIVEILEDHLSHLDAASADMTRANSRLDFLIEAALRSQLAGSNEFRSLAELLEAPLANGKSVPTRDGGFPVLRLTALKEPGVDLSERKSGAWDRSAAERFLVAKGDFLIARGNGSLRLVGRGSLVRDQPDDVAFPDTAIRARPRHSELMPEFLDLVWNSRATRDQVERVARTSAGIYKVNQSQLEAIRLPVPGIELQRKMLDAIMEVRATRDATLQAIDKIARRSSALRRAVLAAAFEGKLTGRQSDNEVIEEMAHEA